MPCKGPLPVVSSPSRCFFSLCGRAAVRTPYIYPAFSSLRLLSAASLLGIRHEFLLRERLGPVCLCFLTVVVPTEFVPRGDAAVSPPAAVISQIVLPQTDQPPRQAREKKKNNNNKIIPDSCQGQGGKKKRKLKRGLLHSERAFNSSQVVQLFPLAWLADLRLRAVLEAQGRPRCWHKPRCWPLQIVAIHTEYRPKLQTAVSPRSYRHTCFTRAA